jgi:hypothetical protein
MAIVLTDLGAEQILKKYFANTDPTGGVDLTLKLFTNNINPADTDVVGGYTEAVGGGYAAKTLTAASFTISTVGDIAQAAYAQQTFTFTGPLTGPGTIYGYFVVDADGVLIYAEKAAVAFTPLNNGDLLLITPAFQLSKGTPT